jgi:hypothetical protein
MAQEDSAPFGGKRLLAGLSSKLAEQHPSTAETVCRNRIAQAKGVCKDRQRCESPVVRSGDTG